MIARTVFFVLGVAVSLTTAGGQTLSRIGSSGSASGDITNWILSFSQVGSDSPSLACFTSDTSNVVWLRPDGVVIATVPGTRSATSNEIFARVFSNRVNLHRGRNFLSPDGEYCCVRTTTNERRCVYLTPCPTLAPRGLGVVTYNAATNTATTTCYEGVAMVPENMQITCDKDIMEWNATQPPCLRICPELTLANGVISYSPNTTPRLHGTVATHSCNTGYELSHGGSTRTCQPVYVTDIMETTAQWSGNAISCQALVYLSLGSTTITTNNTEILISYTGEDSNGGFPSLTCHTDLATCCTKNYGTAAGEWYYPDGSVVDWMWENTHKPFFKRRNAPQVVRLNRRADRLSPTGPYCCVIPTTGGEMTFCANLVVCPSLTLTNGMISYSDPTLGVGSVATHTCDSGYVPSTTSSRNTRICNSDGEWSSLPEEFHCIRDGCEQPGIPNNGHIVQLTGTTPGSLVQYACDTGYMIMGIAMMGIAHHVCLPDGWTPMELPTCQIVDCGLLDHPVNGRVLTNPNTTFNSVAVYVCDSGYMLDRFTTRTCQANGTWSNFEPRCIPVRCMELTPPLNGRVIVDETTFMSIATCICDEGYRVDGLRSINRTCNAYRLWEPDAQDCTPVDCGPLSAPSNGQVDTSSGTIFSNVAVYSCDNCYNLTEERTSVCTADGEWSPAAPTCDIVDCGSLDAPENGRVNTESGTTCPQQATYSCLEGYILNGSPTRICTQNGEWSLTAPTCPPVDCGELQAPTNGHVDISNGTHFQSIAAYSCDPSYNLTHLNLTECAVVECLSNGNWSCDPPFCADNGMIQLKIGPTKHCVEWTDEKVALMYTLLHTSIVKAIQSSGHVIPKENIQKGYFSCYRSTTETTYRTTITGIKRVSAVDYAALIQQWVDSGVTTRVLWYVIKFDKTCPVSISSMEDEECE